MVAVRESACILCGPRQILTRFQEIEHLRTRLGQHPDLSTDLHRFLSLKDQRHEKLIAVLLFNDGVLHAVVLAFERAFAGVGTGLVRIGDPVGHTVAIGPEGSIHAVVRRASQVLLNHPRFHTLVTTVQGQVDPEIPAPDRLLAGKVSTRTVRYELPLAMTLEETLRPLPAKKRKNLAYYRRRLHHELGARFVPELGVHAAESAMLQLQQHTWPHWTQGQISHYRQFLLSRPESFTMGLHLPDETWLSLTSGWRLDGITYLPWQMNHTGYKRESLMQVLRLHLIEHEVSRRQSSIVWVGGTSTMQSVCSSQVCSDQVFAKPGLRHFVLTKVIAPHVRRAGVPDSAGSFLADLLVTSFNQQERQQR